MTLHAPVNLMRQRIVIFEGLDKSGKTTLCRKARFASGHECLMLDRGFIGRRVFHKFRQEDFPIHDWDELEEALKVTDHYAVVFLRIDPLKAMQRAVDLEGSSEFSLQELFCQSEMYEAEIRRAQSHDVPVLELDTGEMDEAACLFTILAWIKGGKEWI